MFKKNWQFWDDVKTLALIGGFCYFMTAQIVFGFRHPWATDTERLIYLPKVLLFQKVDYKEARPRD